MADRIHIGVLSLLVCLTFPACNTAPQQPSVTDTEQKLILEAMTRLQQSINDGNCGSIYDTASDGFREDQRRLDWMRQCGEIRETFGLWERFSARDWKNAGQWIVVEGNAAFQKTTGFLQVVWLMQNGHPQIVWMNLLLVDKKITVPRYRIPLRMDPPMKFKGDPTQRTYALPG